MTVSAGGASRLERMAPLSGVAFAALVIVALGATWDLEFLGEGEELAATYEDDMEQTLAGLQAMVLAAFFLVWFGGTLRTTIRRAVGRDGRLASIAFGGTVAGATLLLASVTFFAAAALRAEEDGEIAPELAETLTDIGSLFGGAAMPVALSLTVSATAVAALRTRAVLPTWLAWLSAVLALALVILPINFIAVLGFLLWTVVVSVMLYWRSPADVAADRTAN